MSFGVEEVVVDILFHRQKLAVDGGGVCSEAKESAVVIFDLVIPGDKAVGFGGELFQKPDVDPFEA